MTGAGRPDTGHSDEIGVRARRDAQNLSQTTLIEKLERRIFELNANHTSRRSTCVTC